MAEEKDELVEQFAKMLTKLRTTSDYDNVLGTLAENLNLSGAPTAAMKALLIHIVLDTFGTSIKAEVVLVGLGLLQGYDNQYHITSDHVARKMLKERRIKFLQESNYLEGRLNGATKERYTSFEDVAKNGKAAIKTVVGTLGRYDSDYIQEVAKALCDKTGLAQYLEESVKQYGITNGDQLIDVNLPVLRYPRIASITTTDEDAATQPTSDTAKTEDTTSSQETEQTESTDTVLETEQEIEQAETASTKAAADQNTSSSTPEPDSRSQPGARPAPISITVEKQNIFLMRSSCVVVAIAVACLILVVTLKNVSPWLASNSVPDIIATQEIVSINFAGLSELRVLAPGESIVLAMEIVPDEIGPEELDYTSDQPEVAYTDKNAVTALSDLPPSIDEVVTITAQKGVVEDKTYVHVLGTDSADIGCGANAAGDDTGGGE